jgi:hypothetical protein
MSPALAKYVADPLERAGATFVEQFVWVLVGSAPVSLLVTQNYIFALDAALLAGLYSLLTSVLTFAVAPKSPLVDLAWRVAKTFLQSVSGTLVASHITGISHADWRFAVALAFPVAMTALLKGLGALALPWTGGASLLPVDMTAQREDDQDLDYQDLTYLDSTGQPVTYEQALREGGLLKAAVAGNYPPESRRAGGHRA